MRSQVVGQSLRGSTRAPYHGIGLDRPQFLPPVSRSIFLFPVGFAFCFPTQKVLCLLFARSVEVSVTLDSPSPFVWLRGFLIQPVYHQYWVQSIGVKFVRDLQLDTLLKKQTDFEEVV